MTGARRRARLYAGMHMYTLLPSDLFRALADDTRLRIVRLLARGSLCVCQIVDALGLPQYSISRHLGILKAAGLVADRREGTWMHYSLHPELPPLANDVVRTIAACCSGGVFAEDDARLREALLRRPKARCAVTERARAQGARQR